MFQASLCNILSLQGQNALCETQWLQSAQSHFLPSLSPSNCAISISSDLRSNFWPPYSHQIIKLRRFWANNPSKLFFILLFDFMKQCCKFFAYSIISDDSYIIFRRPPKMGSAPSSQLKQFFSAGRSGSSIDQFKFQIHIFKRRNNF